MLGPHDRLPSRSSRASRSRSRKLSFSGVISVSAWEWPMRDRPVSLPGVSMTMKSQSAELGQRRVEARAVLGLAAAIAESSAAARQMGIWRRQRQRQLGRRRPAGSRNSGSACPGGHRDRCCRRVMAVAQQRHDHMHGGGRFARAALLVAENDDMRLARGRGGAFAVRTVMPAAPRPRCRGTPRRRRAARDRRWSAR